MSRDTGSTRCCQKDFYVSGSAPQLQEDLSRKFANLCKICKKVPIKCYLYILAFSQTNNVNTYDQILCFDQ